MSGTRTRTMQTAAVIATRRSSDPPNRLQERRFRGASLTEIEQPIRRVPDRLRKAPTVMVAARTSPTAANEGWLTRALTELPGEGTALRAMAVQNRLPRSLVGPGNAVAFAALKDFTVGSTRTAADFEALYADAVDEALRGAGHDAFDTIATLDAQRLAQSPPRNGAVYPPRSSRAEGAGPRAPDSRRRHPAPATQPQQISPRLRRLAVPSASATRPNGLPHRTGAPDRWWWRLAHRALVSRNSVRSFQLPAAVNGHLPQSFRRHSQVSARPIPRVTTDGPQSRDNNAIGRGGPGATNERPPRLPHPPSAVGAT